MAYASDRMAQKREQQQRYKDAVERRLSKDNKKSAPKTNPNEDLLRRRKETGYFGG